MYILPDLYTVLIADSILVLICLVKDLCVIRAANGPTTHDDLEHRTAPFEMSKNGLRITYFIVVFRTVCLTVSISSGGR
jgi:hypothetical protein